MYYSSQPSASTHRAHFFSTLALHSICAADNRVHIPRILLVAPEGFLLVALTAVFFQARKRSSEAQQQQQQAATTRLLTSECLPLNRRSQLHLAVVDRPRQRPNETKVKLYLAVVDRPQQRPQRDESQLYLVKATRCIHSMLADEDV